MKLARGTLLILCILGVSAGVTSAQVKKGYIGLGFGGSLGWSESEFGSGESQQRHIGGGIDLLYFLTDHIAVGGSTDLSYRNGENSDGWDYGLGPAFDYHFRPAKDIVPVIGMSGGISRGETDLDAGGDADDKGWFAEMHGGVDFFLNDHVALNFVLRARRSRGETEQHLFGTTQRFNSRFDDIRIAVGISIFIDTKKRK